MKHYGDITKLSGYDLPIVDVITGGSPCQDLSVAGKRAGLAGERSGLFMEQIRIVKEMREHDRQSRRSDGRADEYIRPRYMVWENVPGAFSSNGGKDFQAVLEETAKVAEGDARIPGFEGKWPSAGCIMGNGWSIAWRVHDAQFWGVPQRRKRIALVADFGGDTAPEILFERKSVSRDIAPGGKEGEGTSGDAERCVGTSGIIGFNRERCGAVTMDDAMPTLQAAAGESGNNQPMVCQPMEPIVLDTNQNDASIHQDGKCNTLPAATGMGGGYVPMVALSFQERAGKPGGEKGILIQDEHVGCLSTLNNQSVCALTTEVTPKVDNDGVAFSLRSRDYKDPQSVCCFEPGAASRVGGHVYEDDVAGTIRANAGDNQQAIVYGISSYDSNSMKSNNPKSGIYEAETARTLDLNGGSPACNQGGMAVVCLEGNGVRPSHYGDGYAESEIMYTMNTTERHAVCVENHPADSRVKICDDGKVQALTSRMETGGGNVPMVMETYQKTTGSLCASGYDKLGTQEAANDMYVVQSSWNGSQISPTLTANNAGGSQRMPDKENFNAVLSYGLDRAAFNQGQNAQYNFAVDEEKIGTQVAKGPGAVASFYPQMKAESQCFREDDVSNTLVNGTNPGFQNGVCTPVVRRLTPLECERLQGYPDGWTDIGEWVDSTGKKHKDADSPRYKALGNSIALPFWSWMAGRMVRNLRPGCTMASLFDGIGGFPFVFLGWGCEPVWASEIEEFPIAVTKLRFPEVDENADE